MIPSVSDSCMKGSRERKRVEELAGFVRGIGSRLAPTRDGIQEAIDSADERGFDLEHIR